MNLSALAHFNLVATHGGFGRASRASGYPKATLSRQVRALEEYLETRLIERGGRELRLTPEGAILHARTVDPFGEIMQAAKELKAGIGQPRGVLRVSAPLLFAHVSVGRLSAAFHAAYPDVLLDVTAEDRVVDLIGDGYDVVVRFNPRPDETLVGRKFLSDQLVLVAPPHLCRPPPANTPSKLPAVVRVGRTDVAPWTIVDAEGCVRTYLPQPVLCLSTPLLVRDAVLAGAGAALVPRSAVAEELASGRLIEWGAAQAPAIEGWVLHASRRLVSPKVSAFVAFLCTHFAN
ncbi:LysR family transcriptional regulator [Pseudomonas gingeri]|uniref:LysR family transcriptional regulator n=1 Tax=Pseudomonas gingeri TaxID=117681 RepID=UPI0015A24E9A|nr:LysR substrate-binding domain-containing protein [Pseudomonas gingeri]NWA25557.1 LysR family transcriptional regulator [Pseudomonas gingeri]NWD68912.1 LysR family transcriptional regulator [Pseudomonas gingeri]NWD74477.1 LysR family transcriptional regulator [Pseudomonas gingeri]